MYCEIKLVSSLTVLSLLNTASVLSDSHITNYRARLQQYHKTVVDKYIRKRENWTTSVLGDILFKNKRFPPIDEDRRNKTFQVLMWKYWNQFEKRFFYSFGNTDVKAKPLEDCSVQNCNFHGNRIHIHDVDAVLVTMSGIQIPRAPFRKPWQKWIFFTEESPPNTFDFHKNSKLRKYADKFNWSMTYRSDSDIPVPYGRTIPLEKPLLSHMSSTLEALTAIIPNWSRKTKKVLVAAMISNCYVKYRLKIIEQLKKYLNVDFYGACSDNTFVRMRCPGRYHSDCRYLSQYYFYLALENSHCRQYITEKVFYNAYLKGAIPIIKGPPATDCENLLPPHSFLHIDNFESVEALAKEIVSISENRDKLLSYHLWRIHFKVTSESGYFGVSSTFLCRVCEALNYNSMKPSIYTYDDIKLFLESRIVCDSNQLERTKPVVIRNISERMCYEIGEENCVEL